MSLGRRDTRCDDDQRDARRLFVVGVLAPHAVIAEMPAVVAPQHDDRVLRQTGLVESRDHSPQLGIHIADGGVVAVDQGTLRVVGNRPVGGHVLVVPQLTAELWSVAGSLLRRFAQRGERELGSVIHVPILLRRTEGEMRFEEADREKERLARPLFRGEQPRHRLISHATVSIDRILHVGRLIRRPTRQVGRAFVLEEGSLARLFGCVLFQRVTDALRLEMRDAPRRRVFGVAVTDVKEFAHRLGSIAVLFEVLRQRDRLGNDLAEIRR